MPHGSASGAGGFAPRCAPAQRSERPGAAVAPLDNAICSSTLSSPSPPAGRALVEERAHRLVVVRRAPRETEERGLHHAGRLRRCFARPAHRLLDEADRERGVRGDRLGQPERGRLGLAGGHHAVHEADPVRLLGRDRAPGQEQLEGPRPPDLPQETETEPPRRHDPQLDLLEAKARVLGGDPDVARGGQLRAPAERGAVDGGDDRHLERFEPREDTLGEPRHAPSRLRALDLLEGLEVATRDEDLVARSGEDHGLERLVLLEASERRPQLTDRPRIERVLHLGPLDRHRGHGARALHPDAPGGSGAHWSWVREAGPDRGWPERGARGSTRSAGTPRSSSRSRRASARRSSRGRPGGNTSWTPAARRAGTSAGGIAPPTTTRT